MSSGEVAAFVTLSKLVAVIDDRLYQAETRVRQVEDRLGRLEAAGNIEPFPTEETSP